MDLMLPISGMKSFSSFNSVPDDAERPLGTADQIEEVQDYDDKVGRPVVDDLPVAANDEQGRA